jgi:predicted acyl esterase
MPRHEEARPASIRRLVRAALLVGLLSPVLGAAPAAAAAIRKLTYQVPVTQLDGSGQPVTIDTDIYLPATPRPRGGYPLIEVFHGGGSDKANSYDSGHAAFFAQHGYVSIIYSQRGNGNSTGQETVAGPLEMHDLFDVTAWALGIGGRSQPAHPSFHINRGRIGLTGYSQGGLNTNLAQVWSRDRAIDPYGISFAALEPGNTPDVTFNALVPGGVVKLSFGVGLLETYFVGTKARVDPILDKWIATAAADQTQLYGGALCDEAGHDSQGSTMKQDLAARSAGCFASRMVPPSLWAQAFDDGLFPADMAISMWRRMPDHADNRLYLSMGGHAAPAEPPAVERDRMAEQLRFFDHFLRGRRLRAPGVVYWTRDPTVSVPASSYQYPDRAWQRHTAPTWPPPRTSDRVFELGADERAVGAAASSGDEPLLPPSEDERNDSVAFAAISATPLGTSPVPSQVPATSSPGLVASFTTDPLRSEQELDGAASARLSWTPSSPDTQLVLELFDQLPNGTLTLLSRGVTGLRGAPPGTTQTLTVAGTMFSARLRRGDRLVAWILDGDPAFYKPYPGSSGGILHAGPQTTLSVPLRSPGPVRRQAVRP